MQGLLQTIRSHIKYKIILPYLALMVLVMLAGSGIATLLIANSLQERFDNYLGQVARNFTGALAQLEQANITFLQEIAFAQENPEAGAPPIAQAMRDRDVNGLQRAMEPYFLASFSRPGLTLDRLIAFDTEGQAFLDWERSPQNTNFGLNAARTDLSGLEMVQRVTQGETDQVGDKYTALIKFKSPEFGDIYYFYTVVPVRVNDDLVGGLMIASRLDSLLQYLQNRSQSALTTIYDVDGIALNSTATIDIATLDISLGLIERLVAQNEQVEAISENTDTAPDINNAPCPDVGFQSGDLVDPLERVQPPACSVQDTMVVGGIEYQFVYAPLRIRGVQTGYFSISLGRDFVTTALSNSRWAIIGVTLLLALGAVVVGFQVARQITNPLNDLVETAEAVTHGQLERRSNVVSENELGILSQAFNQMTEHLLRLYTTSQELNEAIEIEQILAVSAQAANSFVAETEVLVLLQENDDWVYHVRTDAIAEVQQLAGMVIRPEAVLLRFAENPSPSKLLQIANERVRNDLRLADMTSCATVAVAPLLVTGQLIGLLIMSNPRQEAFSDASIQTLTVVSNMTLTVLHNAVLYDHVQRDAKERQAILASIGDGVIVCDDQGKIVMVNRVAEEMLGLHDWSAVRRTIDDLPQQRVEKERQIFGQPADTAQYSVGERIISRSEAPVIGEDGHTRGKVIIFHDVTAAAAIDQAKTDFIATISHELRTPLTVIRGYADLVLRGVGGILTPDQADLIEQVRARAADMTGIVNNAIMIADIEAGKLTTELRPQNLWVILESSLAPLRSSFESKGLALRLPDMTEELPPVLADREQLKLVFTQLLDNARRYTQHGYVEIRVTCDQKTIKLDIEDTGLGIAHEDLHRLFTRFQRIEGNNSAERGSGLGLAITKQLIERQGGQVQAMSTLGKGSVFSIILLQANEQSLAIAEPSAETATPS
jgi:PAS domain S-box-containing protein